MYMLISCTREETFRLEKPYYLLALGDVHNKRVSCALCSVPLRIDTLGLWVSTSSPLKISDNYDQQSENFRVSSIKQPHHLGASTSINNRICCYHLVFHASKSRRATSSASSRMRSMIVA